MRIAPRYDAMEEGASTLLGQQDPKLPGSVIERVPDSIVIVHEDGTIAYVNHQVEELFGYSRNELFGRPVEILMPERFRAAHRQHRLEFAKHPVPRPMGTELEL